MSAGRYTSVLALSLMAVLTVSVALKSSSGAASWSASATYHLFSISSASMAPTLQVGDLVVVDENPNDFSPLKADEIVVFRTPPAARRDCATDDGDLVKRVAATGGQSIRSQGDLVWVKNPGGKWKRLPESYFRDNGEDTPLGEPIIPYTVPKNDLYVLGDNRPISCDSRVWGPLPDRDVIGKVVLVCTSNSADVCKQLGKLGD
jgi:signal peptidase I